MSIMEPSDNFLNPADFQISGWNKKAFTYVSSGASDDDKVATITYSWEFVDEGGRSQSTIKGVLTIAYIGSTNNILSITKAL